MIQPNVEYRETDFGFILLRPLKDGYEIDAYGVAGVGLFELFYSVACSNEDNLEEFIAEINDHEEVPTYRMAKRALY